MTGEVKQNSEDIEFEQINAGDDDMSDDDEYSMMDDEMPEGRLFWSMTIEPKKEQALEGPTIPNMILHITNACFGERVNKNSRTVVAMKSEDSSTIPICVLNQGMKESHSLDLLFNESTDFVLLGNKVSAVTLSGYWQPSIIPQPSLDPDMEDELNEQEMLEYIRQRKEAERNLDAIEDDESEDESPAPQLINDAAVIADEDAEEEDVDDDGDGEMDGDADRDRSVSTSTEPPTKKRKMNDNADTNTNTKKTQQKKKQKQKQKQKHNKSEETKDDSEQSKKSKKSTAASTTVAPTPAPAPAASAADGGQKKKKKSKKSKKNKAMKTMKGGLQYRDMKAGKGAGAQKGQRLSVFYVGQLVETNAVFDKVIGGKAFEFELGAGEVIRGWDMALKGMRVGTKRRLFVPSKLGYGAKGAPPKIPPNADLQFTVELKAIA